MYKYWGNKRSSLYLHIDLVNRDLKELLHEVRVQFMAKYFPSFQAS